jgi:hypothetical protein
MQDGGTGAGAQHGGAGREANLIFVLPPNVYVSPSVGGTFWFQIFIPSRGARAAYAGGRISQ